MSSWVALGGVVHEDLHNLRSPTLKHEPHITLVHMARRQPLTPDQQARLRAVVEEVKQEMGLQCAYIVGLTNFANNSLVCRLKVSHTLVQVQGRLCDTLRTLGFPLSRTYSWKPHITLGYNVEPELVTTRVTVLTGQEVWFSTIFIVNETDKFTYHL